MYNSGNTSKNVTGSSVVDGTMESADYADNGLSGDKIDGGIISNFQSTGIDDRLSSEKAITIDADENVSLNKGNISFASGKGIDFSATSNGSGSMSSEVLDDYETGTFTATLASGATTNPTATGHYTKVGNKVSITMNGSFGSVTLNGTALQITGLPFTSNSLSSSRACGNIGNTARLQINSAAHHYVRLEANSTTINYEYMTANVGGSASLLSQASGTYSPAISFYINYIVA
jgi:hypothetical protein